MARYQSYIICTTPRSGSTLLCRLLAATGKSGNPDSHFHSPSLSAWMRYYDFTSDSFTNDLDLLDAIFRAAIDRGTGDTGVFGLRLQRPSFKFFMQKLNELCIDDHYGSDSERIHRIFGNTLFIHLTRYNKLDQSISLVRARQTGLWHKAPNGLELERTAAPQEPYYDADAIASEKQALTDMEAQWNSWFVEQQLEPLRINYDDLSADPADSLSIILDQLEIKHELADGIQLPVAKLADGINDCWAERFIADQIDRQDAAS